MVGAYQKGSDPMVDAAVDGRTEVLGFLQQTPDEFTSLTETREMLCGLAGKITRTAQPER